MLVTAGFIHSVGSEYRAEAKSQDAAVPPANVSNNEGSMFKVGETWVSPDGLFWVTVESKTATGFVVVVSQKPYYMSRPLYRRRL